VVLLDGTEISMGDAAHPFSLQSLTKLFALCALLREDPAAWEHDGWDASGAGYGSVSELEQHAGQPRNPSDAAAGGDCWTPRRSGG
jgi:glutaminase